MAGFEYLGENKRPARDFMGRRSISKSRRGAFVTMAGDGSGDQVTAVQILKDALNPANIQEKITAIINSLYLAPEWVKRGNSYIENTATGEAHNLYNEAVALIQGEDEARQDALVRVTGEDGETRSVFVNQIVTDKAGGDTKKIGEAVQNIINTVGTDPTSGTGLVVPPKTSIPAPAIVEPEKKSLLPLVGLGVAGALVLYLIMKPGRSAPNNFGHR